MNRLLTALHHGSLLLLDEPIPRPLMPLEWQPFSHGYCEDWHESTRQTQTQKRMTMPLLLMTLLVMGMM